MTQKTLDIKLARILADPSCNDFILADAKDADMARGVGTGGVDRSGRPRTLDDYRQSIRDNVKQGLLDIMLMSASTNEVLTIKERLFDNSAMTPAARANDTTDIHLAQGSVYSQRASRPFRTATVPHIMYGKLDARPGDRVTGADLGLYSITFNNDLDRDLEALQAYRDFRIEAEQWNFRHFLEVFNPNACDEKCIAPEGLGRYINDMIARTLAGVVGKGRPVFLKIAYNGPAAMEQLSRYDRSLVVGILGGAAGTTFDAYQQLAEAKKYGARVALYGRMIQAAEHQSTMIQHLRWIADGQITDAAEGVKSYHAQLQKLNIPPTRSLADDLQPTLRGAAYSASTGKTAVNVKPGGAAKAAKPVGNDKVTASLERWRRVLG